MTTTDIWKAFDTVPFGFFNTVADAGAKLPVAVMILSNDGNTAADNKTYCLNPSGRIELYTLTKDYAAMAEIENRLNAAELPFSHDSAYDSSQRVFMEVYTFGAVAGAVEPIPEV